MDKPERDLFKKTREDLGLTQTAVALAGDVKQSTISKIEIEAKYAPSVALFRKALKGLGLTIVSFYGQIEGSTLPPRNSGLADHESLPPLASEDGIATAAIRRLAQRVSTLERRLRTHPRVRPKNHQHDPTTRAEAAEIDRPDRDGHRSHARGTKRPPKEK